MKLKLLCGAAALMAGSFLAVHADPGEDITNAVTALTGQSSYSWKTTVVAPAGGRFRGGPTEGKTEKDGFTDVTTTMGDNKMEFISKGDKIAVNSPDDGWESVTDLQSDQQGRGLANMAKNFKLPATQAASLAAAAASLTKDGDVISGDMTEAGVKSMLPYRPRGGGGGGGGAGSASSVTDPKGTVKFWLTDGTLTKYEFHVTGKMTFNGNERTIDRDTTVEIHAVGTTKVTPPDEALKILTPKPAAGSATM